MKAKRLIHAYWLLILTCLLTIFLFQFVLFLGYVPSKSMEPTIPSGSLIIGNRLYGELHRGDIVIFKKDGRFLVKRITGISGDVIYFNDEDQSVSVNSSIDHISRILIVPAGSYFVLGDNSEASVDSRCWDNPFIQESCIFAKVFP